MKRVFLYCLLSVVFSSAYGTNMTRSPSHPPSRHSGSLDDKKEKYALDIRSAIQEKLYLEEDFIGKECTARYRISPKGVVQDNVRTEGYKPLCEAAVKAILAAELPAAPDKETYEFFKNAVIDFKPE